MVYHGIPWNTMVYHGIPWSTMVPWTPLPWYNGTMEYLDHGTMEYHGLVIVPLTMVQMYHMNHGVTMVPYQPT